MAKPEIHQWWPHLTIDAKHHLEASDDGRIPSSVAEEIHELTGESVAPDAQLTPEDLQYIRTQEEAVD